MWRREGLLRWLGLLSVLLGGCQIFQAAEAADRISDALEDDEFVIGIGELSGPIAVGARYQVEVRDACGSQSGCRSRDPYVDSAEVSGPFEIVSASGGEVIVEALDVGRGTLRVTSTDEAEAGVDVYASIATRVLLEPSCESEPAWVPPATRVQVPYAMYDEDGVQLVGGLRPAIEQDGLTIAFAGYGGVATYQTPEQPGEVEVVSVTHPDSRFTLSVYDPGELRIEIRRVQERGSQGDFPSLVEYGIFQSVGGQEPCVYSDTRYTVTSDTPEVCELFLGPELETGESFLVTLVAAGSCRLRASMLEVDAPEAMLEDVIEPR